MSEINVISRTQMIIVEPTSGSVSIINAGLIGPTGPPGAAGTIVSVGPTPPPAPALNALWVDTT